ncbi:MAG: ATP-binding cassette domain-containing protein, partial [Pseudomonadota bacterium]
MSQTPPKLELRGIGRDYDGRAVIDAVSIALQAGEVTCLLGPSGCGKSTTLRIAAGVEGPTRGEVYIDGCKVADPGLNRPPEERSVGLMFQDFALFPHLNVADNVAFGLRDGRAVKRERVAELLSR